MKYDSLKTTSFTFLLCLNSPVSQQTFSLLRSAQCKWSQGPGEGDPGFGSSIIEGPSNLTALVGTEAHFHCTVSEGWQILIWLFEEQPILSVTYPGKVIITDKSYSQQGYNKSTEFTSELTIYNVQLNNSGRIECSIQILGGNQYAFLSVQVNGSLNIKDHNLTVRENQTIEIVCEAVGWDPAPHITWMLNNITLDNSNYITNWSQGSNGLYNEESILTLIPLTNSSVICLATILALSKPQSATVALLVYPPPKRIGLSKTDTELRLMWIQVVREGIWLHICRNDCLQELQLEQELEAEFIFGDNRTNKKKKDGLG
ncbi:PREDICTED: immunoglobulin superfamily member 5 [Gekko japonicus]|uniref:immunoglobulin superfamily member 5 n=1 Tax=Gekko japonicus TaxID=146911 RepID=UPI00074FE036|nr:PREDICTED: immunoglobulin superfamily member 5 [Gekko japonicus]